MNLIFISSSNDKEKWKELLIKEFPGLNFFSWPNKINNFDEIEYALVWKPPIGLLQKFTNLKAILSLGAGVDGVINDIKIPKHIPIIRLVDRGLTEGMTEYIVFWTLFHHRHMGDYAEIIKKRNWNNFPQNDARLTRIGILGAGELGYNAAKALKFLNFDVSLWGRSQKEKIDFTYFYGDSGLRNLISQTDILICLLPLTEKTKGILNKDTFSQMKKGAVIINCGRGAHLIDSDLIDALNFGQLSAATLDVFNKEPLEENHPFWEHKKIFLTPHIASLTNPESAINEIASSIRLIESGKIPKHIIDLKKGY